eukprot:scaffold81390_cov57-Phaeocystis_antarctica.AAC.1
MRYSCYRSSPPGGKMSSMTNDGVVQVTGVAVDIETANAPGAVTVNARPLTRQQSAQGSLKRMTAAPTAETAQKGHVSLLATPVMGGIIPIFILASYYRDEWATKYCETNIAEWALVFAWIGAGSVVYQYLIEVWFWRVKFPEFKSGSDAARQAILKRQRYLNIPSYLSSIANLVVFIIGLIRIYGTRGCSDVEYDAITAGNASGCPELGNPISSWTETDCDEACCFKPMHEFGRIYSIIFFVFLGIMGLFLPCACAPRPASTCPGHPLCRAILRLGVRLLAGCACYMHFFLKEEDKRAEAFEAE